MEMTHTWADFSKRLGGGAGVKRAALEMESASEKGKIKHEPTRANFIS